MNIPALKIPTYSFKIKSEKGRNFIFDPFRKKFVRLTPEEWVRMNFAMYLVEERAFPAGRMVIEQSLKLNQLIKRCDILVFNREMDPLVMVECKAPAIKINKMVFDQISAYNLRFKVKFLIVTNGMENYFCRIHFDTKQVEFLDSIPTYSELEQG